MEHFSLSQEFTRLQKINSAKVNCSLAELYKLNTYKQALEVVLATSTLSEGSIASISEWIYDLEISILRCEDNIYNLVLS